MNRRIMVALVLSALDRCPGVQPLAASAQTAVHTISIGFESDPAGFVKDGFVSADSDLAHFFAAHGVGLQIADFGYQGDGQALAVRGDDPGFLQIHFDVPICALSLAFGNDDPLYSNPGDMAVLTVLRGTTPRAQTSVEMNRDDRMNQRVHINGVKFNRATFLFDVTTYGLIEIVDNILFSPC